MSLIRKHRAVLQAWTCLALVKVAWVTKKNTARSSCITGSALSSEGGETAENGTVKQKMIFMYVLICLFVTLFCGHPNSALRVLPFHPSVGLRAASCKRPLLLHSVSVSNFVCNRPCVAHLLLCDFAVQLASYVTYQLVSLSVWSSVPSGLLTQKQKDLEKSKLVWTFSSAE